MDQINHYKTLEKIGSGGMGFVYRAFDTILERDVALKLMHPHLLENEKHAERLIREAQAVARIQHPNIVTIYEVGDTEFGRYIAMEYVNGVSLTELMSSEEGLSLERSVELMTQVLSGLACAHQNGIFHRDIKPDNILLTADGRVKILDFGIAKISAKQGLTAVGDVLGTVEYMAPEQMLGESFDHRCDLYSTGVLLYQLLTGRLPFTGETAVAILFKQLNEEPLPASHFNPKITSELDQVVLKALQKDMDQRWESAAAFSDALLTAVKDPETPAASQSPTPSPSWSFIEEDEEETVAASDKIQSVFVGREKEFKQLLRLFKQTQRGKGFTAVVSGEAGVGKSTFATQLQNYARSQQAFVLYGASLYQEGMDAYMPYIDALRGFFSKDSHGLPSEKRLQIKNLVREKIPVLMEFTERFSTTFDSDSGTGSAVEDGNPINILEGIHLLISLISTMRPVVVVIDDMQWADEASLRLFHYLSRHIAENRILQIGISRTDRFDLQQNGKPAHIVDIFSRMRREDVFEEIILNRFSGEMCEKLIDESLGQVSFSEEFYEIVYHETNGNPFFVLETLKLLRENGTIFLKEGFWHNKSDVLKFEVPNRVEDVFIRQFRELSDDEREILQVASVVGYKFDISVLARILDMKRLTLLKTLQRFQTDLQILNSSEDGFKFEHPLLKDMLYNEIPIALRREYHLMIAEELENIYGPEFGSLVGDVANHYHQGGGDLKALPLLYQAGLRAFKISAYRQACMFLEALLEIWEKREKLPEGASPSELYLKLAICYEENGSWDKSLAAYKQLLKLSETEDEPRGQVDALRRMARIKDHQGKWDIALEYYDRCLKIIDKHPMQNVLSIIYNNIGLVHFQKGDFDLAKEYFQKAIAAVDCEAGEIDKAHASTNLGIIASIQGKPQQALEYYQTALEFYQSRGTGRQLPRVYHNMGMAYSDMSEWTQSLKAYEKCLELLEGAENKQLRGLTYLNMGKAYARQGELSQAKKYADKAFKLFNRMADDLSKAEVFNVLGYIYGEKENFAKAEKYLQDSIRINEAQDYQEGLAESYLTFGQIMHKQGKIEMARNHFEKSAETFKKMDLLSRSDAVLAEMAQLLFKDPELESTTTN